MGVECPNGWQLASLRELGEVNRGRSRHRPRYAEHLYGGPYPFIQTGDVKASNGRITRYTQTYSEAGLAQSRLWPAGTMCITIAANIAETGILTFPACFPDSVVGFIADANKANVQFIEYMFRFVRSRIQHEATGSVQDNINLETLERLHFPLPPLPEQKAIAAILGSLDDKIELNRRMNATLEEMARALFQSWFVDFDPVRAKLDGRKPVGLDEETAKLFPAAFEDSQLGSIPRGWETGSILRQADLLSGGTPKTDVPAYWNGDVPWASAKDVSQCGEAFLVSTERTITKQGVNESSTKIIPKFATVVVARGATTGRLTMFGHAMAMNQTCYGLRSKVDSPFALYCNARHFIERLVQGGHGSVFDTITTSTFEATDVLLAPKEVLAAFDKQVTPLFQRVHANLHQSRTLAAVRDTLLPKLLSGELRVPDVADAIGKVVEP